MSSDSIEEAMQHFWRIQSEDTGITVSDFYCGAGGSTTGAVAAGLSPRFALNHDKDAIETHSANYRDVQHALTDIREKEPRYTPTTDIMLASPECTWFSQAGGRKRSNWAQLKLPFWEEAELELEQTEGNRSRLLMSQVIRFTDYHRYKYVVVENVVDVMYWHHLPTWRLEMEKLGYQSKLLFLNSRFFGVPQSRDRFYAVFWRDDMPEPDFEFSPPAWNGEKWINAVQVWKNPEKRWGKYGVSGQYIYVDPETHQEIVPAQVPSYTIIDWDNIGKPIGGRKRPLSPNTINRIRAGLRRFAGESHLLDTSYSHAAHAGKIWGFDQPSRTQTRRQSFALMLSNYGRLNASRLSSEPLGTIPRSNMHSLLIPNQRGGHCYLTEDPLHTIRRSGAHHAMITAYNGNGSESPICNPSPTQTRTERLALTHGLDSINEHTTDEELDLIIEQSYYRMLTPHELKLGMGFDESYIITGSSKRSRVAQIGAAVTPNVMAAITSRIVKALA